MKIEINKITLPILNKKNIQLFIKRIDKIHPLISGNKWYKLKYNLEDASTKGYEKILTFGGAYSNHILATSYAAQKYKFKSIGIIRGDEYKKLNNTLKVAILNGMELHYVSREKYRHKNKNYFIDELKCRFGDFYSLPEGGTNDLAIKGTSEILDDYDSQDYICCPVGTGGTIAGIINSKKKHQKIVGFPVIKNYHHIEEYIRSVTLNNFNIINTCKSIGYAKPNKSLVNFINDFYHTQKIPLDIIYNGKMMYFLIKLISKDFFPSGSSILAIHTGGIQGNIGMVDRFGIQLPI